MEPIKFATWNINQAGAAERFVETKFDNRWPKIFQQIKDCDADIICLQELRNLDTSEIKVIDILHMIGELGYDYRHTYYGETSTSFALATFYRRDKFFVDNTEIKILPLSDEDNEKKVMLGKIVTTCVVMNIRFINIITREEFSVLNTHFGMKEEEKNKSVDFLLKYIKTITPTFISAGDFNFFDDRDGLEQRKKMLEHTSDLAYPLENASGTFMGFEYDEFKKPFENMSRLDHIFTSMPIFLCKKAIAFGDMNLVKERKYPSDHVMVVIDFLIIQ